MYLVKNKTLNVTYFQNRFASDNALLKAKAAAEGRTVAATFHTEFEWSVFVNEVLNRGSWSTFTANSADEYNNAKTRFDAVVFAQMIEGAARSASNVIAHYAVVLDIDDGISVQDVQKDLSQYEYVLYSSGGTGIKHGERFRVILPLAETLSAEQWAEWSESLKKRFHYSDASFSKSLQIQYLPQLNTVHADKFVSHHNQGRWLDVQADIEFVQPIQKPAYINPLVPVQYDFGDSLDQLVNDLIQHNAGQLEYERRRILGNHMKAAGFNDGQMLAVLNVVGRSGAEKSGQQMLGIANANYGDIKGLYRYLPAGYVLPMPQVKLSFIDVKPAVLNSNSQYDYELFLNGDQYLSNVTGQFEIKPGVNLLSAVCGVGKSAYWSKRPDVLMVCPLLSIVTQNQREGAEFNNLKEGGVGTYQQLKSILNDRDNHDKYANMTLVVDEAHGLYLDSSFKATTNKLVVDCFKLFKSVVLMSGTVRPEYFSNITFSNVVRVNKEQQFEKVLHRQYCENDVVGTAVEHIQQSQNKMVILLNDKNEIAVLKRKCHSKRFIEITADTKDSEEVQAFLKHPVLSHFNYDGVIGTNSIVEGLNINDVVHQADVIVIGNCSPERVQQVTHRFRKVTGTIHTHHFTDGLVLDDVQVIDSADLVQVAMSNAELMNKRIAAMSTSRRNSYVNSYRRESRDEMIYWDGERFQVSYTWVDHEMAQQRADRAANDFTYYAQELSQYGFMFVQPGRRVRVADLVEERAAVKEDIRDRHESMVDLLVSQWVDGDFVPNAESDTPDAKVQRNHVQSFINRGLSRADVPEYLNRLKVDKQYWQRLNGDLNSLAGNAVRDFIIAQLPQYLVSYGKGQQGLTAQGKRDLAESVVQFVLKDRFDGDVVRMKGTNWCSVMANGTPLDSDPYNTEKPVSHLLSDRSEIPDAVLNRYITLGKSQKPRINGKQERVTPILYTSLTGFDLNAGQPATQAMQSEVMELFKGKLAVPDDATIQQATVTVSTDIVITNIDSNGKTPLDLFRERFMKNKM